MALIVCGECGKEFSDKAYSCIHCGCPNTSTQNYVEDVIFEDVPVKKTSRLKKYLVAAVLMVIMVSILETTDSNMDSASAPKKVKSFSHPLVESGVSSDRIADGLRENPEAIYYLVNVIKAYNYKCDSITSVYEMITSSGFKVYCNHNTYAYEVEDKGGNWVVSLR